jgi:hypothetical protein
VRTVPDDVQINPVPDPYCPAVSISDHIVSWRGSIKGAPGAYEIGLRVFDQAEQPEITRNVREGVWQLHEFARIGRHDLMAYASTTRHEGAGSARAVVNPVEIIAGDLAKAHVETEPTDV